jgi:TIR domain
MPRLDNGAGMPAPKGTGNLACPDQARPRTRAAYYELFDRDVRNGIPAGIVWKRKLYQELSRVDAVVCVVTRAYLESMWCTVEVAIADSRGCR